MINVVDKFNMVDMGGIDVVESQGVAVEGLFNRLLNVIQNCRYQVLYNWKFAGIEIPPSYVELEFDGERININDAITVDSNDVIHIRSLESNIEPLLVTENGVYTASGEVSGYSPVTVSVPARYATIRFLINGAVIEEYSVAYGSAFHRHKLIFLNSLFYQIDFDSDEVLESQDITLTPEETNYTVVQSYNVQDYMRVNYDLAFFVNQSDRGASGLVLSGTTSLIVMYREYGYRQCGRSSVGATLPTIQSAGTGRVWYTTPSNDASTTISYTAGQNFFISGSATSEKRYALIKNFFKA